MLSFASGTGGEYVEGSSRVVHLPSPPTFGRMIGAACTLEFHFVYLQYFNPIVPWAVPQSEPSSV
jgi:hypothetical protein